MSNDTTTIKTRPTHSAFQVRKYKTNGEYRSEYTLIGAAWPHGDGEGFNLKLEYLPLNNAEIVIRKPKAVEADAPADETA